MRYLVTTKEKDKPFLTDWYNGAAGFRINDINQIIL